MHLDQAAQPFTTGTPGSCRKRRSLARCLDPRDDVNIYLPSVFRIDNDVGGGTRIGGEVRSGISRLSHSACGPSSPLVKKELQGNDLTFSYSRSSWKSLCWITMRCKERGRGRERVSAKGGMQGRGGREGQKGNKYQVRGERDDDDDGINKHQPASQYKHHYLA